MVGVQRPLSNRLGWQYALSLPHFLLSFVTLQVIEVLNTMRKRLEALNGPEVPRI